MQDVILFDNWGIDLLGFFLPATGQHKFFIVSIRYLANIINSKDLSILKGILPLGNIARDLTY